MRCKTKHENRRYEKRVRTETDKAGTDKQSQAKRRNKQRSDKGEV